MGPIQHNQNYLQQLREHYKKEGLGIIQYNSNEPIHSYPYDAPWLDDPEFTILYDKIKTHTLVDRIRCYSLYLLMQQVVDIPGEILEIGVWKGGTAGILTSQSPQKTVYLADTFFGVVKSSDWEHYKDGAHSDTSRQIVDDLLTKNLAVDNYVILEGIFPEDTGDKIKDVELALVYIDVDVYSSAKDALNFVWENLSVGGLVIFDDYGFISACPGIKKLLDEVKHDKDKLVITNLNSHAYIIKRN